MNNKRIHTLLSLVCVLVLALSIPSMVVAADDNDDQGNVNEKCKLQGTWIWDFEWGKWLMTFNGTGDNQGTMDMEFIGPVMDWCPGCYWSSCRGVWEKSDRNTYDYTYQSYLMVVVW